MYSPCEAGESALRQGVLEPDRATDLSGRLVGPERPVVATSGRRQRVDQPSESNRRRAWNHRHTVGRQSGCTSATQCLCGPTRPPEGPHQARGSSGVRKKSNAHDWPGAPSRPARSRNGHHSSRLPHLRQRGRLPAPAPVSPLTLWSADAASARAVISRPGSRPPPGGSCCTCRSTGPGRQPGKPSGPPPPPDHPALPASRKHPTWKGRTHRPIPPAPAALTEKSAGEITETDHEDQHRSDQG